MTGAVGLTAAATLGQLATDLRRRGVDLVLAQDIGQVRDVLRRSDTDLRVYPTLNEALAAVRSENRSN